MWGYIAAGLILGLISVIFSYATYAWVVEAGTFRAIVVTFGIMVVYALISLAVGTIAERMKKNRINQEGT